MRKKRISNDIETSNKIFSNDRVVISEFGDEMTFEIGKQITTDIAEAVAILLKSYEQTNKIWNIEFTPTNIDPDKALFWLTGGLSEWSTLEHYSKPWFECYEQFSDEFGNKIIEILDNSNTLGDIRKKFIDELSLIKLYEFALSKDLIKINI